MDLYIKARGKRILHQPPTNLFSRKINLLKVSIALPETQTSHQHPQSHLGHKNFFRHNPAMPLLFHVQPRRSRFQCQVLGGGQA
jgi:hypothetical protein